MFTVLNALPLRSFSSRSVTLRSSTANFTQDMEDEKLIELVRNYEFLYNLKHPKYMDPTRKDIAWREIADQLKQSAAACKERWQNLRDAYRRAISKKKRKCGQPAKNVKPWKYENEMAFMLPFFVKRKPAETVNIKSEDEELDDCMKDPYNFNAQYHSSKITQESLGIKIENEVDNYVNDQYHSMDPLRSEIHNTDIDNTIHESANSENNDKEINKSKARKRKLTELDENASDMIIAKLLADQYKNETVREHNELDCFFLTISNTVKKFTPYLQALAKNKIFTLVSEMELQQLAPTTSTYNQYSKPCP